MCAGLIVIEGSGNSRSRHTKVLQGRSIPPYSSCPMAGRFDEGQQG